MTAQQSQTMMVYIADFSKCGTKTAFFKMIILSFGLRMSVLPCGSASLWRVLCEKAALLATSRVPVRIKITGLENVYSFYPDGVEKLLRILRAAEERSPLFVTDIKIGSAIWHCR